ncbi:GTPase-binding protein rid1 [Neolecta irregularis DAH-3]|uniref:GTPase-binding protein rid1 n=1 Tax=Neolecta irregularis (strain DAH-3) TaxID=1198029 RepID=A0A1U7LRA2_NEOID|nr:GTPase-binding protein rid1 [Neolecta irregularis DAH-3]|eukprot:OLL25158.1 GTPase-binding protein rid1 [Neolecta irregularis DAH-3]
MNSITSTPSPKHRTSHSPLKAITTTAKHILGPLSPSKLRGLNAEPKSNKMNTTAMDWVNRGNRPSLNHKRSHSERPKTAIIKRKSSFLNLSNKAPSHVERVLSPQEIDFEFEQLLNSRGIPENLRSKLRSVDYNVKQKLVKSEAESQLRSHRAVRSVSSVDVLMPRPRPISTQSVSSLQPLKKKNRPERANFAGLSFKKARDFVGYLKLVEPKQVEIERVHKLRLLLRNETISWINEFIEHGGFAVLCEQITKILDVEWREEHEDKLVHEILLCMRALCTAENGLVLLMVDEFAILEKLTQWIFSEKPPAEFNTRGLIIDLVLTQLTSVATQNRPLYAERLMGYLANPKPTAEKRQHEFIEQARTPRPYKRWCVELERVARDVFWIFLHGKNEIPILDTKARLNIPLNIKGQHSAEPMVPAGFVGGVEWEAMEYAGWNLKLVNELILSFPTPEKRNGLRAEFKASGIEKIMGGKFRKTSTKFYQTLHENLATWVAWAESDGWDSRIVRLGPEAEEIRPRGMGQASAGRVKQKLFGLGHQGSRGQPRLPSLDIGGRLE